MKTLIYRARTVRGWTQGQLVDRVCQAAAHLGLKVASRSSLRVELSGWENGKHRPDSTYQLLLQEVFNLPAEALGFDSTESQDSTETALHFLIEKNSNHCRMTPEMLSYYTPQLGQHAQMDNYAGPALVVATSDLQLQQLEKFVRGSKDKDEQGVHLASRFAEFNGWLLQDSCKNRQALHITERAIDLAETTSDVELKIYNLMRKSNILTAMRDEIRAAAIARKAASLAKCKAPDLLPVCLRQQAITDASLGDERATKIALHNALSITESHAPSENALASYCTTSYVQMEAALCFLTLRRPAEAAKACEDALGDWPSGLVRDESLCLALLAVSYCDLRRIDEACDVGHRAIHLVSLAPSARVIHMLRIAAHKLRPFGHNGRVRDFVEALAEVA